MWLVQVLAQKRQIPKDPYNSSINTTIPGRLLPVSFFHQVALQLASFHYKLWKITKASTKRKPLTCSMYVFLIFQIISGATFAFSTNSRDLPTDGSSVHLKIIWQLLSLSCQKKRVQDKSEHQITPQLTQHAFILQIGGQFSARTTAVSTSLIIGVHFWFVLQQDTITWFTLHLEFMLPLLFGFIL